MAVTLDLFEYATDCLIQAAYPTNGHHAITFFNTAQLDTAFKQWCTASLLLNGATDWLSIPDHADWDIWANNADDWTLDCWVKHDDHLGVEFYFSVFEGNDDRWYIGHLHGTGLLFLVRDGGVNLFSMTGGGEIVDNDWHHIALCKVADKYGLYVDGTQVNYVQDADQATFAADLEFGRKGDNSEYFDGHADEIRIQHSNIFGANPLPGPGFGDTITVPIAPHQTDTDTKLLLHLDGADAAVTTLDWSRLESRSEDIIKVQGSYSLEGFAKATDALNDTLTRTIAPTINLIGMDEIKFDIRASRIGSNIKIGIHDTGGATTEYIANIALANTFQTETWDISGVADVDKDSIDSIIITIDNAGADNIFYIDNMYAQVIPPPSPVAPIVAEVVSSTFKIQMERPTLTLRRRFIYDGIDESLRVKSYGPVSRASDAIISGGTSLVLLNTDKYWNKFLTDKTNLRKEAKLQIGIEYTPGDVEWFDILTGWADDPTFIKISVSLPIRDKFVGLLEKNLGSDEAPLDYFSASYNPADLTWSILTTHAGLDSTTSTANTDIDYTTWLAWKAACISASFSLKAKFTGQTVKEALELIRDLTNSDIHVAGNGKIKFYRFTQLASPAESYLFDTDKFNEFSVRLDDSKIINYLEVGYDREVISDLIINGNMEAVDSWSDEGTPPTNERSTDFVYKDTYSRKIITDVAGEGAYQDVPTIPGVEYRFNAYAYVSAGDAKIQVRRTFGKYDKGGSTDVVGADKIIVFEIIPRADGVLDGFWIYVKKSAALKSLKGALYNNNTSSGTFIAQTLGLATNSTLDRWVYFKFEPNPPELAAGVVYYLAFWSDDAAMELYYDAGTLNYGWKAEAFGAWPDPLVYDGSAGNRDYSIYGQFTYTNVSAVNVVAIWTKLSTTFIAADTISRVMLLSQDVDASTIYFDEAKLEWTGPEHFNHFYLKEDAASQANYGGILPKLMDNGTVWHNTLASATSYADRRIQIFKDPLEVVKFTSFMMGIITEIGNIIRITNPFFSDYVNKYFRVHKIISLDLAKAKITLEAADFKDVI